MTTAGGGPNVIPTFSPEDAAVLAGVNAIESSLAFVNSTRYIIRFEQEPAQVLWQVLYCTEPTTFSPYSADQYFVINRFLLHDGAESVPTNHFFEVIRIFHAVSVAPRLEVRFHAFMDEVTTKNLWHNLASSDTQVKTPLVWNRLREMSSSNKFANGDSIVAWVVGALGETIAERRKRFWEELRKTEQNFLTPLKARVEGASDAAQNKIPPAISFLPDPTTGFQLPKTTPLTPNKRMFKWYGEYTAGTSNKFWMVQNVGNIVHRTWGRIGSKGSSTDDVKPTDTSAFNYAESLAAMKRGEGYVEKTLPNYLNWRT